MTRATPDKREAARLLQALEQSDDLACEQAHDLLPALVDAELAGEDVDAAPEYAALLRHLDQCEACATLYAGMSDSLAALADTAVPLPADRPAPPAFFAPARQSENVVLRVLGGLARHFELVLHTPQLALGPATLGGGPDTPLFVGTLPEVEGSPLVSVSLSVEGDLADLFVAIREAGATTPWQVQLSIEDSVQTATTDERGIARFNGLPLTSIWQVTINASEVV
ncbi:MAG: zf-HC2 domain-containing protein [Roseiflexaceae bacterium]